MSMIIDGLLFLAGLFVGILWFSTVILPLFYGIPRATWWFLRGRVRWRAILGYIIVGGMWFLAFFGIFLFLYLLLPNVYRYIYTNSAFNVGELIGFGASLLRAVGVRSARKDLNLDFFSFVKRYATVRGGRILEEGGESITRQE